jgi:hypothetical protein
MSGDAVGIRPITSADIERLATFLHTHLNSRVSAAAWAAAMQPPWSNAWPNHGFFLQYQSEVVGVYLAFYSDRMIDGRLERFCNLGAWCVLEEYRAHGLRLIHRLLGQRGYHFTDLSPRRFLTCPGRSPLEASGFPPHPTMLQAPSPAETARSTETTPTPRPPATR